MKKYLYQFAGGTAYTSLALFAFCWIALWYGDFRIIGGYGGFDKSIAFGMFCIVLYLAGNMLFVIKTHKEHKIEYLYGFGVMASAIAVGFASDYGILKLITSFT